MMRPGCAAKSEVGRCTRLLALAAACAGCGDVAGTRSEAAGAAGRAVVGGSVVSTVDGRPIALADVQALVDASGLAPSDALRRLQDERLLIAEVARRGVEPDAETRRVARQALVQALLDEEAAKVEVTREALRAAYEAQKSRFAHPEKRRVLHVLAVVPEDADPELDGQARDFTTGVIRRFREAEDVEAAWNAYRGAQVPAFKLAVEHIPAFDRAASLVEPFKDAVFGVSEASVVPEPVRTSYGWHAIAVVEIVPALDVPFEDAIETLRPELSTKKRKERLDALLERLRRETGVRVEPDVGERLSEVEP